MFGSWMQITALGFLIYQLTSSVAYLGYVGFASGIVTWICMIPGGILADRYPRRKILIITQSCQAVLASILAVATLTGNVQIWHVFVVAALTGMANAFDAPARHSFVPEMVPKSSLENAFALNSVMLNLAVALGPAIAGIVFAVAGPGWCFALNAASFGAVLFALLRMRKLRFHHVEHRHSIGDDIQELVAYVRNHPIVLASIGIVGLATAMNTIVATVLPAWSVQILQGDATTNGVLQSARGIGALVVALVLTTVHAATMRGRMLFVALLYLPLVFLAFTASTQLGFAAVAIAGFGALMNMVSHNNYVILAHEVHDVIRGRIMGLYNLVLFGVGPVIALAIGIFAEYMGLRMGLIVAGIVVCAITYAFWLSQSSLRRLG
jgi:MFS family permease